MQLQKNSYRVNVCTTFSIISLKLPIGQLLLVIMHMLKKGMNNPTTWGQPI